MAVGAVSTGAMYDASPSQLGLPAVALARGYVASPYQQGLRAEGYPMRDSSKNYAIREFFLAVALEVYRSFGNASGRRFGCLKFNVCLLALPW